MNIETEIEATRAKLAELESKLAAQKSGMPEDGQKIYILVPDGTLSDVWLGYGRQVDEWKRGNIFLTREEAEAADRVRIAVTAINREVERLNDEQRWVADWRDSNQEKSSPLYDNSNKKWKYVECDNFQCQFTFINGSKKTWDSVIKTHHAELEIVRKGGVA